MKTSIMLVDDTPFIREMLRDILEKNDYLVVAEACNGLEAVETYKIVHPDLVIMDITMPQMDGLTALVEIRKYDPNARIIICSTLGQRHLITEAIQHGAKDFITKPFMKERVLTTIESIVIR